MSMLTQVCLYGGTDIGRAKAREKHFEAFPGLFLYLIVWFFTSGNQYFPVGILSIQFAQSYGFLHNHNDNHRKQDKNSSYG